MQEFFILVFTDFSNKYFFLSAFLSRIGINIFLYCLSWTKCFFFFIYSQFLFWYAVQFLFWFETRLKCFNDQMMFNKKIKLELDVTSIVYLLNLLMVSWIDTVLVFFLIDFLVVQIILATKCTIILWFGQVFRWINWICIFVCVLPRKL